MIEFRIMMYLWSF